MAAQQSEGSHSERIFSRLLPVVARTVYCSVVVSILVAKSRGEMKPWDIPSSLYFEVAEDPPHLVYVGGNP